MKETRKLIGIQLLKTFDKKARHVRNIIYILVAYMDTKQYQFTSK